MLIFAKVFAIILSILVIARSLTDYKNKKESLEMTAFWLIIWTAIIVFAYYPNLIDKLIAAVGGSRTGLGTIFGMGLVFVMFISYRIYVKTNRVEKTVNEITRIISLRDIGKKIKKKNGQISKK